MDKLSWRGFQSQKKPSLTGHSASHTHTVQTRAKRSRNTHVPPHATRLHKVSSGSAAGREPHLGVSPASFPFSSAQTKKVACSHETLHLEATLLEIPNFEDQFCHASTSPTRLGMRRTGEPPTCSQCGARVSNTGKNTPRSSDVQKKMVFNASSMSLAQIKWKHLHFHRCAAFDMSLSHVRTRSTCVKSEDTTVLFPLVKKSWNCLSLLKRNVKEEKYTTGHNKEGSGVSKVTSACTPSLLPTLLRFCDLRLWGSHSTSSASAHGTRRTQPRFLITCVFFLFFVSLLLQVLRFASVACPGCLRCRQCSSMLKLVCGFVHGRS